MSWYHECEILPDEKISKITDCSDIYCSLSKIRQYCSEAEILGVRDLTGNSDSAIRNWLDEIGMLP